MACNAVTDNWAERANRKDGLANRYCGLNIVIANCPYYYS